MLLVTSLSLTQVLGGPPKVGEPFPDLTKAGLEGKIPAIKDKVILVDFFASWCGPCKESFPAMQELHKKYSAQGLVIIAINEDEKKEDMEAFLKKFTADFAVLRDPGNRLVSEVKIATMPSSYLLDKTGRVRAIHKGYKGPETLKKYMEEIEGLLK